MLTTRTPSPDPVAVLAASARRRAVHIPQPTVADLVDRAIADTDFLGDLTPNVDVLALASICADQAAEYYEDSRDVLPGSVAPELVLAARDVLAGLAEALRLYSEIVADDALADAIEAGDADHDGAPVAYDFNRGA